MRPQKIVRVLFLVLGALACNMPGFQASISPVTPSPRAADGVTNSPATSVSTLAPGTSSIAGCPLFPVDNVWNTRVDTLPVDPHSDAYIAALGPDSGIHPDFGSGLWEGSPIGIPFTLVPGDQPRVEISFDYDDESDPGPYPIPPDALIEGGPDADGDRHILIVDQDNCRLYEIYHAYPQEGGNWQAGSGAVYDLRSNSLRPDSWTSADAAGLPMLPGLVRNDEVAAGVIPHAIRFTAASIRSNHIWPARHHAECGSYGPDDTNVPPYGQRFRLKASFDIAPFPRDVQVILTALKTYGVILADCGADWYIGGSPDEQWNNDVIVDALRSVRGSDFEAVDESGLMVDLGSGQARQTME